MKQRSPLFHTVSFDSLFVPFPLSLALPPFSRHMQPTGREEFTRPATEQGYFLYTLGYRLQKGWDAPEPTWLAVDQELPCTKSYGSCGSSKPHKASGLRQVLELKSWNWRTGWMAASFPHQTPTDFTLETRKHSDNGTNPKDSSKVVTLGIPNNLAADWM